MQPPAALLRRTFNRALKLFATMRLVLAASILFVGGLSGCGGAAASTAGSCGLDLADGSDDATAIRAVLEAEGSLVVAQAIEDLMALWAEDAFVANAKNTARDASDDQFWRGKDAIRHRYVRTVFPGAPAAAAPAELAIEIDAGRAVVTATTRIGDEVAPAGDRWVLSKQGKCWLIESLTYNLESS
ncbi:MAG: hypothetical protein WAU00_22510 [Caldilinea sp.]|uniref:hypothetical protein n=1 Tax=Caldilinea sp. TaxID=2293560 RepID=UPI002B7968F0|nr:hypothetical protein [Anaerolineales bacterium]HQY94721.1 hypothetical protein [Caldilinea sp.]HRA66437.1 hypothetical protein [Caldilinea sp.]